MSERARVVVDVQISWGTTVLYQQRLDPPRALAESETASGLPVIAVLGSRISLVVPEGAVGVRRHEDGSESALTEGEVPLACGESASMEWEGTSFFVASGRREDEAVFRAREKRRTRFVALSIALHAGLLACAALWPSPSADEVERDRILFMQRYLNAIAEREEADGPDAPNNQEIGTRAKAEVEQSGASRAVVTREASEFGMIGLTSASPGDPPISVWGASMGDALGSDVGVMGHGSGSANGNGNDASLIRAGEWDDNANYREFQSYLTTSAWWGARAVDVSDRQFLVVRDARGRGVPSCLLTVTDAQGKIVHLRTTASGRALLFPHAEGLAYGSFRATAACSGAVASAEGSTHGEGGVVTLDLASERHLDGPRQVEIAFVLDTTGSMSEELAAVKSTIRKVARSLPSDAVHVRVGMVEYKDRGDRFVTRVLPMTADLTAFSTSVDKLTAEGGGDTPESVNEGLHAALSDLSWSYDSTVRMAFLIGDAPPHLDYAHDYDYSAEMKKAAHAGIPIFTVAASGMDATGQTVWRQIAQYTGGTNMFILRGGAGPQSTGAGDPRSSCGGTQTAYASGNLDSLILKKISAELASVDGDPMRIAGLSKDEKTRPCSQQIARR